MRIPACLFVLSGVTCFAQSATLTTEATPAENQQLRAEAVRLMEQANRATTPTTWPANEQTVHFRIGHPEPGQPLEGDYTSAAVTPGQRRQEWHYGTFSEVQVRNGSGFTVLQAEGTSPGFLPKIAELTPAWHGHFDHEDIIRSIAENGDGNKCIEFVTVFGDRHQQNEVCVSALNGWLESIRIGDKVIRNSNFFPFSNAALPGHVEEWVGGSMVMTVDQTIVPKEFPPDFFGAPKVTKGCTISTRPSPINIPQPEQQSVSTNVVDVVLNGLVDTQGHTTQLKPLDNLYPDLNHEAVDLVSKWTYAAGSCNGVATTWGERFVVHFVGR
jgi:hypothetical protein